MLDIRSVDPELRRVARLLPRGYGLQRGLGVPRAVMKAAGWAGRIPGVQASAVNADVGVRVQRPTERRSPGPALLWIHGGGTVMGSAAQEDKFIRKLVVGEPG